MQTAQLLLVHQSKKTREQKAGTAEELKKPSKKQRVQRKIESDVDEREKQERKKVRFQLMVVQFKD